MKNSKLHLVSKLVISFFLILGLKGTLNAQTITITGPLTVGPSQTAVYDANFTYTVNPSSVITWSCTGGTILSQNVNPGQPVNCTVKWGSATGSGSLCIYETPPVGPSHSACIRVKIVCGEADGGPDVTLCSGGCSIIGVPAQPNYTYSWTPTTGLSNPNIAQPTACPLTTTIYSVNMQSTNGCPTTLTSLTVTVNPTPSISPAGPIDYYIPLDFACPSNMTFNSSSVTGNQWYKNNQAIPGATGQTLQLGYSTGQCVGVGGQYYTMVNGCSSNVVTLNMKNYGYGFFGEEPYNFGATFHPANSPGFYCLNTNGLIKNINLGSNTTYSWYFTNLTNPASPANILLNTATYNPSSPVADIIVGGDPYSGIFAKGVADKNGEQAIIDYLIYQSPYVDPVHGNNYTICSGQTANINVLSSAHSGLGPWQYIKPGGSNFDWEEYEFGPNTILLNYFNYVISNSPLKILVPGGNQQSQSIQVRFSGSSYVHKRFYHNNSIDGCAEENFNVVASVPGCLRPTGETTETITIYPNPSTSLATIRSDESITEIEILDINNVISYLKKKAGGSNTVTIDISSLKPGIYLCKVVTKTKTEFLKMQIVR